MPAAGVSGVIAVCTYGLYGCATTRWGMSPAAAASGVFDSFWDTIGFITNGLVFFYAGVATTNFFVRSTQVRGPAGGVTTVKGFQGNSKHHSCGCLSWMSCCACIAMVLQGPGCIA